MSYVTPITDRSASDYTLTLIGGVWINVGNNSKAFFNCTAGITIGGVTSVDDWGRVYGNAQYVNAEILANSGHTVPFTTIATPTTAQNPTTMVTMFNNLLANIEAMRVYINTLGASISAITTLVYVAGAGTYAPNYLDINQWENCLNQIKLVADTLHEINDGAILWDNSSDMLWDDSSVIDWSHIGV